MEEEESKSCKLPQGTQICPRCQHHFVPDEGLESSPDPKNKGKDELNVLTSCPVCGHNFKPRGTSH